MFLYAMMLTLATGFIWSLVGVVYSHATQKADGIYSFLAMSSFCFALTVWVTAPPAAVPVAAAVTIAAVMIPAGILGQLGFYALYGAMQRGGHGISWAMAQAAMLCPFAAGILFFGEPATPLRLTGMTVLLAALILLAAANRTGSRAGGRQGFLLCAFAAFAFTGGQQVLTLLPNHLAGLDMAALSWRVPLLSLCGLGWIAVAFYRRQTRWREILKLAVWYGVLAAAGQWTLFYALDCLSGIGATGIAYPLAVGSSIILFFVYSQWFRKEKNGLAGALGISLAVLGIMLLAF